MPGLEFRFYRGTEDQEADPSLVDQEGDLQPAYKGWCYIVFDRLPITDFRRVPSIEAVIAFASAEVPNIGTPVPTVNGASLRNTGGHNYVYDRERNLVYFVGSSGGLQTFVAVDARSGAIVAQRPWLDFVDEMFPNERPPRNGLHSIAGATGPYLVAQTGGEGAGHLFVIDKDTLAAKSVIGEVSNYRFTRKPADRNDEPIIQRASQITTVNVPDGTGGFARFIVLGHGGLVFNTGGFSNAILRILPGGLTEYVWGEGINLLGGLVSVSVRPLEAAAVELLLVNRKSNISQPAGIVVWRIRLDASALYDFETQITLGVGDPVRLADLDFGAEGLMRSHYDSATDSLILTEAERVISISAADGSQNWVREDLALAGQAVTYPPRDPSSGYLDGSDVAVMTADEIVLLDPATGAETRRQLFGTTNYTYEPEFAPGPSSYIWDPVFSRVIHSDAIAILYDQRVAGGPEPLRAVIAELCDRAGLLPSEIGVDEIDEAAAVDGYGIERESTARGALEPLGAFYNFDAGEVGRAMRFRHRAATPDLVISDDELILAGDDTDRALGADRGSAAEAPRATTVSYLEAGFDYQEAAQTFTRAQDAAGSGPNAGRRSMSAPFVLSADQAMQVAERATIAADLERERRDGVASQRLFDLAPLDRLQINGPLGQGRVIRVERVRRRGDYAIEFEGPVEAASLYEPGAIGVPPEGRGALRRPFVDGPTGRGTVIAIDSPLLADTDAPGGEDVGVIYAIAIRPAGAVGNFQPTQSYLLDAAGTATAGPVLTVPAAWGILAEPPPLLPGREWNGIQDGSLTVRVQDGLDTLASISEQQFLAGAGNEVLLLTERGPAELVRFRDVVPLGDGLVRLSRLIRGKRGTDPWATGHVAGRTVIFVGDRSAIAPIPVSSSLKGKRIAVSGGVDRVPEGVEFDGFQASLWSLRPWRPWVVERRDQGTDIVLTWRRRGRRDVPTPPANVDPPVGNSLLRYRVEVGLAPDAFSVDEEVAGSSLTVPAASLGGDPAIVFIRVREISTLGLSPGVTVEVRN
ncbi:MAG: phage tail protein [Pseudomonadota bacterium]